MAQQAQGKREGRETPGGQEVNDARKAKIIAAVKSRGWFTSEIFPTEANELYAAGIITLGYRYSCGGNHKTVWVAA